MCFPFGPTTSKSSKGGAENHATSMLWVLKCNVSFIFIFMPSIINTVVVGDLQCHNLFGLLLEPAFHPKESVSRCKAEEHDGSSTLKYLGPAKRLIEIPNQLSLTVGISWPELPLVLLGRMRLNRSQGIPPRQQVLAQEFAVLTPVEIAMATFLRRISLYFEVPYATAGVVK